MYSAWPRSDFYFANFQTFCLKTVQVRNLLQKLQLEETRRDDRLREVVDSKDSVATATAKESVLVRYEQVRKKIQVFMRGVRSEQ